MAFTAKILSWHFHHLNIVGCLLKRRPTKGGSRAPQDPPGYTPALKTRCINILNGRNYILVKVTKKESIIGHGVNYNGLGVMRGQSHIPSQN